MKKLVSILLTVCLIIAVCPLWLFNTASAANISNGYYYTVSNDEASITGAYSTGHYANIPSEVDGYPVTSIGISAFRGFTNIKWINIPDSVTNIGPSAFYGCTGLTGITIGKGVTSIGNNAFYNCCNLTNITIPDSVTSIGDYAFYRCYNLTNIAIPYSVTSIGDRAFHDCTGLTSITIGKGVTSIGNNAFYNCCNLTNITIPDSVTSIGDYAFKMCTGLTSVTIPENVISIGNSAFYDCTGLSSVNYNAINCISMGTSSAPVFLDCDKLVTIHIGEKVESIPEYAFYGCKTLKGVNITDISAWCNITFSSESANPLNYAKKIYLNGTLVTELIIPDGVTKINKYTFANCESLESVTMPNSVNSIGEAAFRGCENIESITLPFVGSSRKATGENGVFGYIFGYKTKSDEGTTEQFYKDDLSYFYYIPSKLKSVVITDAKWLSYGAFYGCENLTDITINEGATDIGSYAFFKCKNLTELFLPGTIERVGLDAFGEMNWYSTWKKFQPDGLVYIGKVLMGCKGNHSTNLVIKDGTKSINSLACSQITSVVIPESVENIKSKAFNSCTNIESITVPFIGGSANSNEKFSYIFGGNVDWSIPESLKEIIITQETSIDSYDFMYCDNVESIVLSNTVKSIASYAFQNCYGLRGIKIPGSVGKIEHSAFQNCTDLTTVEIERGVKEIGVGAFNNCSSLRTLKLTKSIEKIDSDAFKYCPLSRVLFVGTTDDWYSIVIAAGNTLRPQYILPGDINEIGGVTDQDAVHLLYHTFLPNLYPVNQDCDFNGDNEVNDKDAIYLLYYTFLPDLYPID